MKRKNNFLHADNQKLIREAVAKEERITSGEIVPLIVKSSSGYSSASLLCSMVFSMIIALAVSILSGRNDMWSFVAIYALAYIPCYMISHYISPLKRLFISRSDRTDAVRQGAFAAFYRNGLYRTRDETGILIYISLFERTVWILADRGINARVQAGTWDSIVTKITSGIRDGEGVDSLVESIHNIGDILRNYFPVKSDDKDELSNLIIDDTNV